MEIYIGIDVGLEGAVAILDMDGKVLLLESTPILAVANKDKIKRDYQIRQMIHLLSPFLVYAPLSLSAAIESVHAMPKQGVRSCFTFGRGLGIWEGILCSLFIPYSLVLPQRWKKVMLDGMGKEKDASRLRAMQLFPSVAGLLSKKKDHGKAEALLLAEYLKRTWTERE